MVRVGRIGFWVLIWVGLLRFGKMRGIDVSRFWVGGLRLRHGGRWVVWWDLVLGGWHVTEKAFKTGLFSKEICGAKTGAKREMNGVMFVNFVIKSIAIPFSCFCVCHIFSFS